MRNLAECSWAFFCGRSGVSTETRTERDLLEWFLGFGLACREARLGVVL